MDASPQTNALHRQLVLQHLYQARCADAESGAVTEVGWTEAAAIKVPGGDMAFSLGVLVELGHARYESHCVRITGPGVIACEAGWVPES